jgi:autotransporter-associated beta strand protein
VIEEQNTATLTNIVKTGPGRWVIRGGVWNGGTTVEQGTLEITGAAVCASAAEVESGASLVLTAATLDAESLTLNTGSSLQSSGASRIDGELNNKGTLTVAGGSLTVDRAMVNSGTVEVRAGAAFTASAEVINDGTMRFLAGSSMNAAAGFTNNGLLDLLTSDSTLPAAFENNGTVILNSSRRILSASRSGTDFTCTIHGYVGHSYQLQHAAALSGPWTNAGTSRQGGGAVLTFTHTGPAAAKGFYRVLVSP